MENVAATEDAGTPSAVPAKSNLLVVGHGGCGANALKATLKKYDPEENSHLSLLAIESNQRVLASCSAVSRGTNEGFLAKWLDLRGRFCKIQLGDKGLGAGGDVARGEEMARRQIDEIKACLTQCDNAVLIGGGGGGTCGSMPVIAEALMELDKPTYAILTMPRVIEGPKKAIKANAIRDRMFQLCPTTLIENERIPNKALPYSGIWNEINEGSLFWILWLLKALLQDEGDVIDLDGSDWKTAMGVGKYTLPGFYDASQGLDNLEKGLLGNPYLDARIIAKALAVVFWFEGIWSVQEHDQVVECVRSKMKHDDRDEELELKWGIREYGVPEGMKTVGFVGFAKEGPDSLGEYRRTKVNIPLGMETGNGKNTDPVQVQFEGVVGGKKIPATASPDLVTRYSALFARIPSLKLYQEAEEVQRKLRQETGITFDVPVKPSATT